MLDDGAPGLEVGFQIDTGGSIESVTGLEGVIDRATAGVVADAKRMEQAVNGISFGGATVEMKAFAATTSPAFEPRRPQNVSLSA